MSDDQIVCGICGYDITDTESPCPYCGATPDHFVEKSKVDAELLKKIYKEGGATY